MQLNLHEILKHTFFSFSPNDCIVITDYVLNFIGRSALEYDTTTPRGSRRGMFPDKFSQIMRTGLLNHFFS